MGDQHFNDPIARYVPQLIEMSNTSVTGVVYDDVDKVQWNEVTVAQLASHLAGILRDCE